MFAKIIWLAGAGALGTLARLGLGLLVQRHAGTSFPWGTLAVNATGCLAFGAVWVLVEERVLPAGARMLVLGGFLGAFTTFSSFAFEASHLMTERRWGAAAAYLAAQNGLGLACVFLGAAAARGRF